MEEMSTEQVIEHPETGGTDLISKTHATELIKREKEVAYKKAQREFQAQLDQMKTGQTQNMGGMSAIDPEEIANKATEKAFAKFQEQYEQAAQDHRKSQYSDFVNDQAKTYLEKMDKGSGLADDFKEMTSRFKPDKFKEVFFLANSYENTPAIIYELGQNPEKLAMIDNMINKDPDMAKVMMDRLSQSINFNQSAKDNNKVAEQPLSRPKPSLAAGADQGQMSLADLKKSSFLRG